MKSCPKCNARNFNSATKCDKCGFELDKADSQVQEVFDNSPSDLKQSTPESIHAINNKESQTPTSDLKANHDEMLKQIRSWGLWSLGLGALHIIASGLLDSSWGILLIVVGLASFYYRTAPMFIIYSVTLAWAALSNLSSLNPEWMLAALFQFFLAFRTFKDFQRFGNTENELAQLSNDILISNKRATKSFPFIGILLSCSSIIGVVAYCVLTFVLVEEFGADSQPPAYYSFLIRLVEVIGVLGFSVSLASLLAKPAKKFLPLIGVIAGGVIMIFYLLVNISLIFLSN